MSVFKRWFSSSPAPNDGYNDNSEGSREGEYADDYYEEQEYEEEERERERERAQAYARGNGLPGRAPPIRGRRPGKAAALEAAMQRSDAVVSVRDLARVDMLRQQEQDQWDGAGMPRAAGKNGAAPPSTPNKKTGAADEEAGRAGVMDWLGKKLWGSIPKKMVPRTELEHKEESRRSAFAELEQFNKLSRSLIEHHERNLSSLLQVWKQRYDLHYKAEHTEREYSQDRDFRQMTLNTCRSIARLQECKAQDEMARRSLETMQNDLMMEKYQQQFVLATNAMLNFRETAQGDALGSNKLRKEMTTMQRKIIEINSRSNDNSLMIQDIMKEVDQSPSALGSARAMAPGSPMQNQYSTEDDMAFKLAINSIVQYLNPGAAAAQPTPPPVESYQAAEYAPSSVMEPPGGIYLAEPQYPAYSGGGGGGVSSADIDALNMLNSISMAAVGLPPPPLPPVPTL